MKVKVFAVVAVLSIALLAACGGGGGEADSGGSNSATIDVVMNDIFYGEAQGDAVSWTVPAGATVTVNLDNRGALEHNFAIVNSGETVPEPFDVSTNSDILFWDSGLNSAGESSSVAIQAPTEAGTYTVICTDAGHYPQMQGELVVEG